MWLVVTNGTIRRAEPVKSQWISPENGLYFQVVLCRGGAKLEVSSLACLRKAASSCRIETEIR